jgi:hypothetical protein
VLSETAEENARLPKNEQEKFLRDRKNRQSVRDASREVAITQLPTRRAAAAPSEAPTAPIQLQISQNYRLIE